MDVNKQFKKITDEYLAQLTDKTEKAMLKEAEELAKELKEATPRSNNNGEHMAELWKVVKDTKTNRFIVYNDGKGSLIHLLEFGTVRMGKRPFIVPTYDKNKIKIMRNIKNALS